MKTIKRSIGFHVSPDGAIAPSVPQYGGVKGEHNTTKISMTFIAPVPYQDGDLIRLRFTSGDGAVLSSDLITEYERDDTRLSLSYLLPSVLTCVGGQLCVRVVLSRLDENGKEIETWLSDEAVLYFDDAVTENGTPFWTGVSEMLKRTVTASDAATAARDAARDERETATADADRAERCAEAASTHAVQAISAEKNAQLYASTAVSARDIASAASEAAEAARIATDTAKTSAAGAASRAEAAEKTAKAASSGASASEQAALKAAETAVSKAQEIASAAEQIEQNTSRVSSLITLGQSLMSGKLDKSGHKANKYLGTDDKGNVVTKDAPEGGGNMNVEAVPAYVVEEAKMTADKVLAHQSEDSFTLAWLSDLHIGNAYQRDGMWVQDETSNVEAGQGLHEMSKRAPCDLIAVGGDLASGTIMTSHEEGLSQLDACVGHLRPATFYTPTLYLMGNHDDAPWRATADRLTRAELFSRLGRKNRLAGAVNENGCLYGYMDFEAQKMRVIYLDTHDKNGWESANCVSGEATVSDYMNACNISAKQLDWLANTALDFSEKESPSEWGVVVLSHTQLTIHSGTVTYTDAASGESYDCNTDNAIKLLDAYLTNANGSITHGGETVFYDFSDVYEKAHLYCHIHGHRHAFTYDTLGAKGIPSIGCPNTRDGSERESDDGNIYTKTAGTGESCSFNVITIDRKNGKVYADNYGAGIDRAWDAAVYSAYTNLVPTSLDTDLAAVYNGVGYANDMRISAYNASAGAGHVATGIMPYAKKADGTFPVLYVKGAELDTTKSYVRATCIQNVSELYATASAVGGGSGQTAWEYWFVIETLGERYYKLTPTDDLNAISANTKYIRMSLYGTGDGLIITADEPIE